MIVEDLKIARMERIMKIKYTRCQMILEFLEVIHGGCELCFLPTMQNLIQDYKFDALDVILLLTPCNWNTGCFF